MAFSLTSSDRCVLTLPLVQTSAETTTHVALPGGQKRSLTVHVWNGTVANLTLMALGSSAPEILLSVIEICGNSFYAGELGPSTIVGSAAFNLMVISAVCVTALPEGEGRYIREQSVFVITGRLLPRRLPLPLHKSRLNACPCNPCPSTNLASTLALAQSSPQRLPLHRSSIGALNSPPFHPSTSKTPRMLASRLGSLLLRLRLPLAPRHPRLRHT